MNNPLFSHRKYLILYIGTWMAIAAIHVLILILNVEVKIFNAFLDSIVHNFMFAITGFIIWFPIFYNKRGKSEILNMIMTHLLAGLILISLWYAASSALVQMFKTPDQNYNAVLASSVSWRVPLGVLYYVLIALTYYLILFYRDLNEKINHEAELKRLVTEAELQLLRSQINPHFLFNSLNSINTLAMTDPDRVQQMIIKLSDYMRYSLRKDRTALVPLSQELQNIQLYLDIEKVRFGKKLTFQVLVPDQLLKVEIPHMILQPLIENAVKYGVYESLDENKVDVDISKKDDYLVLKVINDFEPQVKTKGEGHGLVNIRKRLKLIYQQENLLSCAVKGKKFEALLRIPLNLKTSH